MAKNLNIVVFIYLLVILLFTLSGKIIYGHGIGDLIYIGGLILIVIAHLIIGLIVLKKVQQSNKNRYFWILGMLLLIVAILYTIKFTIGRGSEYL